MLCYLRLLFPACVELLGDCSLASLAVPCGERWARSKLRGLMGLQNMVLFGKIQRSKMPTRGIWLTRYASSLGNFTPFPRMNTRFPSMPQIPTHSPGFANLRPRLAIIITQLPRLGTQPHRLLNYPATLPTITQLAGFPAHGRFYSA